MDARADTDAVISRIDRADMVEVLAEIDLTRLMRESSGTVTEGTLDAVRDRSVAADRWVTRIADRLMKRPDARGTRGPLPEPEET